MHRRISKSEIRANQLEVMNFLVRTCEENQLRYFLAGGTLLGAVRHKGYIPWDDDIDIAMPRPDYEKLLELSKTWKEKFSLVSAETCENYFLPFAKIFMNTTVVREKSMSERHNYGIFVDIFPLDGLGNCIMKAALTGKMIVFLSRRVKYASNTNVTPKNRAMRVVQVLFNKFEPRYLYFSMKKIATRNDFEHSKLCGSIIGGAKGTREIFTREIYGSEVKMEFEGEVYSVPRYYDVYLTRMYGDYMQLPPKEERVSHHEIEAWIKEENDR